MQSGQASIVLTGWQVRAARAALRLSVQELARESGVSERTIKRIEAEHGFAPAHVETLLRLNRYFISKGFSFIPENGSPEGPGVRWGSYPGRSVQATSR